MLEVLVNGRISYSATHRPCVVISTNRRAHPGDGVEII